MSTTTLPTGVEVIKTDWILTNVPGLGAPALRQGHESPDPANGRRDDGGV